jgi:hypothetical protein
VGFHKHQGLHRGAQKRAPRRMIAAFAVSHGNLQPQNAVFPFLCQPFFFFLPDLVDITKATKLL